MADHSEPVLETVHVRDHDLAVRAWGVHQADWQAVLIHGYGEHAGRYDHVADRLRDEGATVVAMDHRGHGRSEGEPVLVEDFEQIVSDVVTVITDQRVPETPLVVIGHSMGGMIAARLAQRGDLGDDLAALVLSGPVLGSWDAATDLLEFDEIPDEPLDPDTLSRDPEVGRAYAQDDLVWHGPFKRTTLEAIQDCLATIAAGGELEVPTLWVHGKEDALVPMDATRMGMMAIRPATFSQRLYDGARHEVFNETNRDEVLDDVVAFITTTLAESEEAGDDSGNEDSGNGDSGNGDEAA